MSITRRIIYYFILILNLSLIVGLAKNSWRLMHADEEIKQQENKLAKLKKENKKLKEKYDYYQSEEFIEKQIRDKLGMAKPGEAIVILPEKIIKEGSGSSYAKTRENKKELANWQKWLGLFW